jgi:hypothetical protein
MQEKKGKMMGRAAIWESAVEKQMKGSAAPQREGSTRVLARFPRNASLERQSGPCSMWIRNVAWMACPTSWKGSENQISVDPPSCHLQLQPSSFVSGLARTSLIAAQDMDFEQYYQTVVCRITAPARIG